MNHSSIFAFFNPKVYLWRISLLFFIKSLESRSSKAGMISFVPWLWKKTKKISKDCRSSVNCIARKISRLILKNNPWNDKINTELYFLHLKTGMEAIWSKSVFAQKRHSHCFCQKPFKCTSLFFLGICTGCMYYFVQQYENNVTKSKVVSSYLRS